MRFETLDLVRYGPFTDCTIAFRPGAALHVVYGPNEAGKSSMLAAIRDLLFGFEHTKAYDFLHDASSLRVGATIVGRSGERLSFRRRRGRKGTLLSPDAAEQPLNEDALAPFLGTLTRPVFSRAFGLDSHRLREGAAEMLASDGELGGMLFAAASGLSGLARLRTDLAAEADKVYAPRASRERLFYQILSRHEEARRAEREAELRASDWKALLAAIAEARAAYAAISAERVAVQKDLARLGRLRSLDPIVADMDALARQLGAYGDLPELPMGFAARLTAALAEREAAEARLRAATVQTETARDEAERIDLDTALLEVYEQVTTLFAQTGNHAKLQEDLPRIEAERDEYAQRIAAQARRLGLDADAQVERLQPSDATLARLRALIERGRALDDRIATLSGQIAEARGALDQLDRAGTEAGLIDPEPWRARLAALAGDLRQNERRLEREAHLAAGRKRLAESAARLDPPVEALDRLAVAALPSMETMARFRETLAAGTTALHQARARQGELAQDQARLAAGLEAAEATAPIVSQAMIAEARARRDTHLAAARASLDGDTPVPAAAIRQGLDALAEWEREADRLADQALMDADRVSRHAAGRVRLAELGAEHAAVEREIDRLTAEAAGEADRYRAAFAPLGIAPKDPEAMAEWLRQVAALLAEREALDAVAAEIGALGARESGVRLALQDIARGVGIEAADHPTIGALAQAVTERIDTVTRRWVASREIAGRRADTSDRLARLEGEIAGTRTDHEAWRADFAATLAAMGLAPSAGLAEAGAALAVWEQVPNLVAERDNRVRRVNGIARDIADFTARVNALVAAVAPDLGALPPGTAVTLLRERCEAARAAQQRKAEARQRLADAEAVRRGAIAETEAKSAAVLDLVAGRVETDELDAAARRIAERERLLEELEAARARFGVHADGLSEHDARAALDGFDREQALVDMEDFGHRDARLVEEGNEAFARLTELDKQRAAREAGAGAEGHAFLKYAAEAEIVDAARRWAVLRLAGLMLSTALERRRQSAASPLLERAGTLFATLTNNAFAGLVQDYDDSDTPRLRGARPDGARIAIEAMSEGTCDQLYLALRLAFLADYASRNEPAPFIGDDIFQTFDDARTAAGLRALARTGAHVQLILFTHHESVVAIAQRELGETVDVIAL